MAALHAAPDHFYHVAYRQQFGTVLRAPEASDMVTLIVKLFDGYFDALGENEETRLVDILSLQFGLLDESFTYGAIGDLLDLSSERVRQLSYAIIERMGLVFSGQIDQQANVRIALKDLERLTPLTSWLQQTKLLTEHMLQRYLIEMVGRSATPIEFNYLLLFLYVRGYRSVPATYVGVGDPVHYFYVGYTRGELRHLCRAGNYLRRQLNNAAIPISYQALWEATQQGHPTLNEWDFQRLLTAYSTIESVDQAEVPTYQFSFFALSTRGRLAKRVLYELGKISHIDEIVTELNKRFREAGREENYERESIRGAIIKESGVESQGKMSRYALASWGYNTDSISTLIRRALLGVNQPMILDDITNKVLDVRPNLLPSSVRSVACLDLVRLFDGSYILPEWRVRYVTRIQPKYEGPPLLDIIIGRLLAAPNRRMQYQQLREDLLTTTHFSPHSIYHAFYIHDHIEKVSIEGESYIQLDPNYTPRQSADPFIAEVYNFLRALPSKCCTLRHLRDELNSTRYAKTTIYRKISQYSDLVEKFEVDGTLWVRLRQDS